MQAPTSKLDDDAFTRVRFILMNGLESEALRFAHSTARMNGDLRLPLAQIRRVEQHQQTMVNWLLPADLSPLETTIGLEQVAIEVTASVALREPTITWHSCTGLVCWRISTFAHEEEHLENVREWLSERVLDSAQV